MIWILDYTNTYFRIYRESKDKYFVSITGFKKNFSHLHCVQIFAPQKSCYSFDDCDVAMMRPPISSSHLRLITILPQIEFR